jgi:hypothetical protein
MSSPVTALKASLPDVSKTSALEMPPLSIAEDVAIEL